MKIKIFYSNNPEELENEINDWLLGKDVVSMEQLLSESGYHIITFLYKD